MWKTLHQLAIPPRLYQICGWFIPWLAIASVVVLTVGWIWGFGFAPADYQQGNSYRIIYLHVPAAIWSMGIYASMAVAAFIGLVWQMKMANLAVAAMAPIGAVFTFIALVTGSAWGKPMWGTWWVWDARLTSELVLLFLYVGVLSGYDAIIQVGGSFFVDLYGVPQFEHALCTFMAKKPLFMIGHSVGPFQDEQFNQLANYVFGHCDALILRESVSLDLMKRSNITTAKVEHGVDTALC